MADWSVLVKAHVVIKWFANIYGLAKCHLLAIIALASFCCECMEEAMIQENVGSASTEKGMYRWYAPSRELRWEPEDGVNAAYANEVLDIRRRFSLARYRIGVDVPQDLELWVEYAFRDRPVFVRITEFQWGRFEPGVTTYASDGAPGYREAVFYINLEVAMVNLVDDAYVRPAIMGPRGSRVVFARQVRISFPPRFPVQAPAPQVPIPRAHMRVDWSAHEHHWFAKTHLLCLLRGATDWDEDRRTTLTVVDAVIEWVAWHVGAFGWA
jgi:hypothetical protein